MRFLHAADVHLDSPPGGVGRDAVPRHLRADATRGAFRALVDLALREQVDFVIIAGDLYDADQRDFATALFFAREMARLAPVPCVLIRGNHDARSVITKHLTPPPNVRVLSSRKVETFVPEKLDVAIHGRSFADRAVPEDMAVTYPPPVTGMFNIGVLHTSLEGASEHDTYAPCSIETLLARGYDYWALGHIHQRRVVHRTPPIVFPGNIQGRNPRETGAKGCMIVDVEEQSVTALTFHPLDVMRWEALAVDLDGVAEREELVARARAALSAIDADGRPLVVRLTLTGTTALHPTLVAEPAWVDAECRAASDGEVLLERVILATRAPAEERTDPLAPLFRAALTDEGVMTRMADDLRRLRAALPAAAMTELPENVAALGVLADDAWALAAAAFGEG